MNKRVLGVSVLAVAVLTAGCGSSSSGSSTTVSSSSAPPSSSASSSVAASSSMPSSSAPAADAPDQPKLATAVLKQSDFPTGWASSPSDGDADDAANQAALVACVGGTNTFGNRVANADAPDFGLNDLSVSSSAASYKSQADIEADTKLIQSPKISTCYEQLIKVQLAKSLPTGSTLGAVAIKVTAGSGGGPSNIVAVGEGTIVATVAGAEVTVYTGIAFITGPLTEAQVEFDSPGQPVDATLFANLVKVVADRVAAF
jgi:hypothetical protein